MQFTGDYRIKNRGFSYICLLSSTYLISFPLWKNWLKSYNWDILAGLSWAFSLWQKPVGKSININFFANKS